jgi:RNA polymerase sigma-70 factor (ECF subfamily)
MTQAVQTSELTDGALLTKLAAGDKAAWDTLVRRHADIVFSVVSRIVREPADAEDAGQEAFLRLKDYAHTFDKVRYGENARNWIATIACREALKINARRANSRNVSYDDEMGGGPSGKNSAGQSQVEEHEVNTFLREAVQDLPQRQRQAIVMHFVAGMTQMEIASELSCDQSTISDRIRQGLDKLRQRLGASGVSLAIGPALIANSLTQQAPEVFVKSLLAHSAWAPAAVAAAKGAKAGATVATASKAAYFVIAGLLAVSAVVIGAKTLGSKKGLASASPDLVGSFEDNTTQGWAPNEKTKIAVEEAHATDGRRALHVEMEAAPYPGIHKEFSLPQDWRQYRAIRASIYNESNETLSMSTRVDDESSKGFGSRFNGDDGCRIYPGANEAEISVGALWNGSLLSRGLEVDKIKSLRFFINGTQKPVSIYFDNVRLISARKDVPESLELADLSTSAVHMNPLEGTTAEKSGASLKLLFTPGHKYSGIEFFTPQDWLSYDEICVDMTINGKPLADGLSLKVFDVTGKQQTINTHSQSGECKIRLPVELFSSVALGRVRTFSIFTAGESQPREILIHRIYLQRHSLEDGVSRHGASPGDPLTLDFSPIRPFVGANSFQAIVWIPVRNGGWRVVRCNAEGSGPTQYSIPASELAAIDTQRPVRTWAFYLDHGVIFWKPQDAAFDPAKPQTVTFDSLAGFSK